MCWDGVAWFLDNIFGDQQMASVERFLWLSKDDQGFGDVYWSSVNDILDATIGFGFALITIFFLSAVFSKVQTESLTVDALIKLAIQVVIAAAVIGNIREIINGLLSFGESILNAMPDIGGATAQETVDPKIKEYLKAVADYTPANDTWNTVTVYDVYQYAGRSVSEDKVALYKDAVALKAFNEDKFIKMMMKANSTGATIRDEWRENAGDSAGFGALIESAIAWIFHQIAIIGIDFAAFSRGIELGWRIAFAPVFASNTFEGGLNSPGIRYLKTLLGVAISGAAIWAVAKIGFSLAGDIIASNASANMWASIACMLATAGAAIGIGNKVSSLFG